MWTKFHWFRTNPDNVDIGLNFFRQIVHRKNQCLETSSAVNANTQLTVTASISMNKADAPQTDDTEAVGPMNSAEENALRYVAGWAISKLKN